MLEIIYLAIVIPSIAYGDIMNENNLVSRVSSLTIVLLLAFSGMAMLFQTAPVISGADSIPELGYAQETG